MRTDVIVLAILLMPWNVAFAQTACPQGVAAGSAQCGPSSLVNPGDSDYRFKAPALPQEKWSDSWGAIASDRSEEHTSELQSLMRISYAVFCLKKKKNKNQ